MITSGIGGVEFVVVNTDRQDLNKSKCDNKLQIGEKLTGGMGAGSKPDIGKKSAEESRAAISKCLEAQTWSSSPPVWAAAPARAQPRSLRISHMSRHPDRRCRDEALQVRGCKPHEAGRGRNRRPVR